MRFLVFEAYVLKDFYQMVQTVPPYAGNRYVNSLNLFYHLLIKKAPAQVEIFTILTTEAIKEGVYTKSEFKLKRYIISDDNRYFFSILMGPAEN